MTSHLSIQYVHHQDINKTLWDACIDNAGNGMIYAKSYYLDHIAHHWDAIIVGNYTAVMPLPWNQKFTIKYVYPPPFCQQLGLFSTIPLDDSICKQVIQQAVSAFRFGEYYFNYQNKISPTAVKKNYILDLNNDYAAISNNYHPHLKRNLKKAQQHPLRYIKSDCIKKAVLAYKETYGNRFPHVIIEDYERLISASQLLYGKQEVLVREVKDANDQLLALTLCLKDHRRIYLLLPTTTAAGRTMAANHFMLDQIIKEFSMQPLLLDFEGSNIPGVARFYKDFGSSNQPYFFYRWNKLPWPINLLKERAYIKSKMTVGS